MSINNESLILKEQAAAAAAPFLFSEDDLPAKIDKTKPKFHCTGERLFRDRPDVYKAVVKLVVEPGVSIRTVCRELHVSDHTVRSVVAREKIPIAAIKKEVLVNITHGIRLASERVIELMPEASARDALLGVGILGDKMALLSGEPTVRVEIGHFDLGAELRKLEEAAMEKMRQAKAHVIDPSVLEDGSANVAEMGVEAKNIEQKALMNGDHEQPRHGIVEMDATSALRRPDLEEEQE